MRKTIKHNPYSLDEKINILNEHLNNNIRVIDICRKYDIVHSDSYKGSCVDNVPIES